MSLDAKALWMSALLAAAALSVGGCRRRPAEPRVTIGGRTWRVELATTRADRLRGLGLRDRLDADRGMLFVYPREKILNFCMRDCRIDLDIAFIDGQRRIVGTRTMRVEPGYAGEVPYRSPDPAQYALEVAAGQLAGVQPGDRVIFSEEVPSPAKAEPGP